MDSIHLTVLQQSLADAMAKLRVGRRLKFRRVLPLRMLFQQSEQQLHLTLFRSSITVSVPAAGRWPAEGVSVGAVALYRAVHNHPVGPIELHSIADAVLVGGEPLQVRLDVLRVATNGRRLKQERP